MVDYDELRAYAAAQLMPHVFSAYDLNVRNSEDQRIAAERAVKWADALIAALQKESK